MKHENAIMNEVFFPTVSSQASAYDIVFVIWQTRPISPKVYAEMTPINAIKIVDGITADGAFPKAATPVHQEIIILCHHIVQNPNGT